MFTMTPRVGIIVWLRDYKRAKALEQHGLVHYVSRKMRYAVLYVNAEQVEDVIRKVSKLPYVKTAERSFRNEIRTDYGGHKFSGQLNETIELSDNTTIESEQNPN